MGKNKILNRIFIFFITQKMKKMILVLAGAIIKSTDPKNNNRLTAEMWDQMLDFFKKINARLGVMQKQLNDLDYTSSS